MKEKTVLAGEYQIFLSTIQISNNINDLLIYAQHIETKKPYTKSKEIYFYDGPRFYWGGLKNSSRLQRDEPPVLFTTDYNLISQIRYVDQPRLSAGQKPAGRTGPAL